jgi:hypothetical protein
MNILQGIIMSELMKAKTEQPTSSPQDIERDAARWRMLISLTGLSVDYYGPMVDESDRPYGGRWICELGTYHLAAHIDALIADHASADHSNEVQS